MSNNNKLIYLGIITKAHGVRGDVCIKSLTANPTSITKLPLQDEEGNVVKLKLVRSSAEFIICSVSGISDRNAAEAARGTKLYTTRSELPEPDESEYYLEDMKDLEVRDPGGSVIGKVLAAHNFGAGDIIEIAFIEGESEMYPFTQELFPSLAKDHVVFMKVKVPD